MILSDVRSVQTSGNSVEFYCFVYFSFLRFLFASLSMVIIIMLHCSWNLFLSLKDIVFLVCLQGSMFIGVSVKVDQSSQDISIFAFGASPIATKDLRRRQEAI